MAENQAQQLLMDFLNAFYAGDVERALTYCDDEIDFLCYAPIDILPHLGHKHGKTEMLATWKTLHERYASMRHELPFIVAENDKAAVIIRVYFRKRIPTGSCNSTSPIFIRFGTDVFWRYVSSWISSMSSSRCSNATSLRY